MEKEDLELDTFPIRCTSSPCSQAVSFTSVSAVLRSQPDTEQVLRKEFVEFMENKAGPGMGFELILEIANHLLPRESNPFHLPSLPPFPPSIHSIGIHVSGSVVDAGDMDEPNRQFL